MRNKNSVSAHKGAFVQFALRACSQIFNQFNVVERMNYAHEIIGTHGGPLLLERALEQNPGTKPLVCISLKT